MITCTLTHAPSKDLPGRTDVSDLSRRTRAVLDREIDFVPNPEFVADPTCEAAAADLLRRARRQPRTLPAGLPSHLARLCAAPLLTADDERQAFRAMNYLKFRANALRVRLNPDDPDEAALAQVEHLLASAALLRDQILQANMRLVVSVVKKFVTPQYSFDELLSDGICSLMQAVDKFDFDRGYRFSTYAYRAISRNAYREVMNRQRQQRRYVTGSDEVLHGTLDQRVGSGLDERTWERLRGNLLEMLGRLDRREQFIIAGRYALGAHRRPRTFQELADRLGVSKERARQLEQRAVSRLRQMAADTAREAAPTVG